MPRKTVGFNLLYSCLKEYEAFTHLRVIYKPLINEGFSLKKTKIMMLLVLK